MNGRRITAEQASDLKNIKPGDYWHDPKAGWYVACPVPFGADGYVACIARLSVHTVIEYDDGTISVSPSIVTQGENREFHGWLERGVWKIEQAKAGM